MSIENLINLAYQLPQDETGYSTIGHQCISDTDNKIATDTGSSVLFGEFLFSGATLAFNPEHLNAAQATVMIDLGMGLGKLLLQAYLQYANLSTCLGVELSPSRYQLGHLALERLVHLAPELVILKNNPQCIQIENQNSGAILEFRCENLFEVDIQQADIVILETNILEPMWPTLEKFLKSMKSGARILTYENLTEVYGDKKLAKYFMQIPVNCLPTDRFRTTWSPENGHHFYLWTRR